MSKNNLQAGDTIKCRDFEDMRAVRDALKKDGYKTKVIYTTIFIEGRKEEAAET